jgi:hypothetical protein
VTPPRAPRQLVVLFPIAFVPSRHFMFNPDPVGVNLSSNTSASTLWMHARPIRFTCLLPRIPSPGNSTAVLRPIHILQKPARNLFSLPVVSNTLRGKLFRETGRGRRSGERLHFSPQSRCVPADQSPGRLHAAGYYTHSRMLTSERYAVREVPLLGCNDRPATLREYWTS